MGDIAISLKEILLFLLLFYIFLLFLLAKNGASHQLLLLVQPYNPI